MIYFIIGLIVGIYLIGDAYDHKITKEQAVYIDDLEYRCKKVEKTP